MSIKLQDQIYIKAGKAPEPKSYKEDGTPYSSVAEANGRIPIAERYLTLPMFIGSEEYWYKEGVQDVDLVPRYTPLDLGLAYVDVLALSSSLTIQEPTVVDVPITINFGATTTGQGINYDGTTDEFICTESGYYDLWLEAQFGRTSNVGVSYIVAYQEINLSGSWIAPFNPTFAKLDNLNETLPYREYQKVYLEVGNIFRFKLLRDSQGINNGGLYSFNPTIADPNITNSPSAQIKIKKAELQVSGSALPVVYTGVPEAPATGLSYVRANGIWVEGITKTTFENAFTALNNELANKVDLQASQDQIIDQPLGTSLKIQSGNAIVEVGSEQFTYTFYLAPNYLRVQFDGSRMIYFISEDDGITFKTLDFSPTGLKISNTDLTLENISTVGSITVEKILIRDNNGIVKEIDRNDLGLGGLGGGIPEPSTDGNWLRNKLSGVYSWVEGVTKSTYDAALALINSTLSDHTTQLAKYPTEGTSGKFIVGNGAGGYEEGDVTISNTITQNITAGPYPPIYPFVTALEETFSVAVTTANWVWNGAVATNDTGNSRLSITGVTNAKGAKIPFLHIAGMKLKLILDITVPSGVVDVRSQYNTFVIKDLTTGIYEIEIVAPTANPVSYGRNILLSSSTSSDFFINDVKLYYYQDSGEDFWKNNIKNYYLEQDISYENRLYNNNFTDSSKTKHLNIFGSGNYTINSLTQECTVNLTTIGGNVFTIGYDSTTPIPIPKYSIITFEIVSLSTPLRVQPVWANATKEVITTPGIYTFHFERSISSGTPSLDYYCISADNNSISNFVIKNISIKYGYKIPNFDGDYINIGRGTASTLGITMGVDAKGGTTNHVQVGNGSRTIFDNSFGGTAGEEITAIGNQSLVGSWRGTTVGAKSYNYGVSATSLGATNFVMRTHDVVLGRGAYGQSKTNPFNQMDSAITFDPRHLYFGNGHAHKRNTSPSGIGCKGNDSSPIVPVDTECVIHGQNAYDDRFPLWNSLVTYTEVTSWTTISTTAWVRRNDTIYVCILSNTNIDPATDVPGTPDSNGFYIGTYWKKVYDLQPGETAKGALVEDGVQKGGHIALESGTGTGGEYGGEVRIYTHPAAGEANNVPTTRKLTAKFVSNPVGNTSFMLLDTNTNTWYSVKIGTAGTGPGGVGRVLYVE